jgi:hypothetical protein
MERLCTPAIIYVVFSVVQILMDLYTGLINTALIKFIVMVIMTILLNILCQRDLAIISWIIVFIPFIMMTFIVSLILYIFGLSKATGSVQYSEKSTSKTAEYTAPANVLKTNVYSPETPYNPQPSIYPPAMGYPPANSYNPASGQSTTTQSITSQTNQQTTDPSGQSITGNTDKPSQYNYMNISKFYPYPTTI